MKTAHFAPTLVVVGLAAAAHAQQNGDVVITDELSDSVLLVDKDGAGTTTLVTLDPDVRLSGITNKGGTFYVGSDPSPAQNPSVAAMFQIDDLFGTPSVSTLTSSDPLQRPIGMLYDPITDQIITVNNPGAELLGDDRNHGILTVDPNNGNQFFSYQHPDFDVPGPVFRNGGRLDADPFTDDFFVTSGNGGEFNEGDGPNDGGSQLYRFSIDPDTLVGDAELWIDLSDTGATGLGEPMSFSRGVAVDPSTGDVYATDSEDGLIVKIEQNGDGSAGAVSVVTDQFPGIGTIVYNQFTNRLVFGTLGTFGPNDDQVWSINLDGSDPLLLAEGVEARGIVVIPAPASVALLGMGALAAFRRRR